jgi:hypothetical protein
MKTLIIETPKATLPKRLIPHQGLNLLLLKFLEALAVTQVDRPTGIGARVLDGIR